MKMKVFVQDLVFGMYVSELDRSWLGTPFLFQGFLVETQDQIEQLQQCCVYVYVDLAQGVESLNSRQAPEAGVKNNAVKAPPRPTLAYVNDKPLKSAQTYGQDARTYPDRTTVKEELGDAGRARNKTQQLITSIIQDIRNERIMDVSKIKASIDEMVESIVRNPDALLLLTQLRDKDIDSYGQAVDVSIYLLAFGRHLGFPKEELRLLGMGGLLQDIGKLKLPLELLRKKDKFTPADYEMTESHVLYSVEILRKTPGISPAVIELVATHHERQDGSGYPRGLSGESIGALGSMAAIVDTFSALTRERPYASSVSPREALEVMSAWRGKYLHGGLLERFTQCIGIYPVGSLVELNTGEVAVVLAQNRIYHFKPRIIRILGPDKKPYDNPSVLDLYNDPVVVNDTPYQIRKSLEYGTYDIDPKQYYL